MTGINPSLPSFYPGPGDIGGSETPQEPATTPTQIDQLLQSESSSTPLSLYLSANPSISLTPGSLSLIELTKLISSVISKLRESLNQAELLDDELTRKFHLAALDTANGILDDYSSVVGQVNVWNNELQATGTAIQEQYDVVEQKRQAYTDLLNQTAANDATQKATVNQYIDIYNDPTALQNFADSKGMTLQQAVDFINQKINDYNNYMSSSSAALQSALNDYNQSIDDYNSLIDGANSQLDTINSERTAEGLSTLPYLDKLSKVNSNVNFYINRIQPQSLPNVSLPAGSTHISDVTSQSVVNNTPPPNAEPVIPRCPYSEALRILWLPSTLPALAFLSSFNRILDLAEAYRQSELLLYRDLGFNILSPSQIIESAQQVFLDSVGVLGGGIGLASFALGLHSRNLEIALSSAVLRSLASNWSMPITGRQFARLQFTALELLQRSSLLSPMPALRFIASSLGMLGSASPAINVAISLAITEQVLGIAGGGVLRNIVNAQFNRMPFFARIELEHSMSRVVNAEIGLNNAIASGNPSMIRNAIQQLGSARIRLANATRLANTFGMMSIGGMAAFTSSVSATMSLSILTVALAQLGRAIGMPGLIPQMYAQLAGIPTIEILAAMSAGSRILDVLDNPLSILALKQTLVDSLVFGRGFNSVAAGLMINSAINNVILNGGVVGFSQLQSRLAEEYMAQGFSFFQANMLANETTALIRGDMGVNFLNVAFGLNFDRSIVASSIVNNILGIDRGFAGAMLSNAVARSLLLGGFGSTVALQGRLTQEFLNLGLSFGDASSLSQNMASLIGSAGVVIPFASYPGVASLLLGNEMLSAIAFGSNVVRDELRNSFMAQGLNYFQADFLASQVTSLAARTFTSPGNLFEIALEAAIGRAGTSFQTQREFRDELFRELRGVGFNLRDAMYLANSAASFGLNGALIPLFGVSPDVLSAIGGSVVNRISAELGVSPVEAQAIYAQAEGRALSGGPYSSPDQFQTALKEEVFRSILSNTGRPDGNVIFDHAMGDLANPAQLLNLAGLTEQISNSLLGLLRPDLGSRLAQEIKDQILLGLLGGTTVDEIENPERRNPLSVLNQMNDSLQTLLHTDEEEDMKKTLRKLIQLLQAMLTPNAEIGFLLQSLSDSPSTFIGNLASAQDKKGVTMQMQA